MASGFYTQHNINLFLQWPTKHKFTYQRTSVFQVGLHYQLSSLVVLDNKHTYRVDITQCCHGDQLTERLHQQNTALPPKHDYEILNAHVIWTIQWLLLLQDCAITAAMACFIRGYTHLIATTTNLVRVNLSEGDELHIGMADNRSTNTPVEEGWGVV